MFGQRGIKRSAATVVRVSFVILRGRCDREPLLVDAFSAIAGGYWRDVETSECSAQEMLRIHLGPRVPVGSCYSEVIERVIKPLVIMELLPKDVVHRAPKLL